MKHLSVFALAARGTIYKLLAILAAMAAAETGLFYLAMQGELAKDYSMLERALTEGRIGWVCAAAFVAVMALLVLDQCSFSSKTGCTLRRLSISELTATAWKMLWNAAALFLFWSAQVLLGFALCQWYVSAAPADTVSGQSAMLAFYRSPFLHNLLPLENTEFWVRNIIFLPGLAISAACGTHLQRRGKLPILALIQTALTIFAFYTGYLGGVGEAVGFSVVSIFLTVLSLFSLRKEARYEKI